MSAMIQTCSMTAINLLLLIACLSTQAKTPAQAPPEYHAESKAYVKHANNTTWYVTENRVFNIVSVRGDNGESDTRLLLLGSYHNEIPDSDDGPEGNVVVQAWTLLANGQRKARWEVHQPGNEGTAGEHFFEVTQWGCCAWPNVTTYYSLLSGKKVYAGSSPMVEVSTYDGKTLRRRYLVFGYSDAHKQEPVLEYGDGEHIKQTIVLKPPSMDWDPVSEVEVSTPSIEQKSKRLLELGASDFTFMIRMKLYGSLEVRIPVENDVVHPEKAVLPAGYSLKAIQE